MSNTIDFYQPEQNNLAIPSAATLVLVDGEICGNLFPIEIIRSPYPEFGRAKLSYIPCNSETDINFADIENFCGMGKPVSIQQTYNCGIGETLPLTVPVFDGFIEKITTSVKENDKSVEIIAKDFSARLQRITVYGRYVSKENNEFVFLPAMDTSFNTKGKGNAAQDYLQTEGRRYAVFSSGNNAKDWTYAEIIFYLLNAYIPFGQLQLPTLEYLISLTNNQISRELDLTGLNLIEALQKCCLKTGIEFCFTPRLSRIGARQAIIFYRAEQGRVVELNCQKKGETLSISGTNIAAFTSKKNFWPVTKRYIGQGDFKLYESTFDLVKAWDSALEGTDYEKYSPLTNANFTQIKEVYRKWVLNEAGDYSDTPYCRGEVFDFTTIFETQNFINQRRRFWPALTADNTQTSLGYYLEVSYDNGEHWWLYTKTFNILTNECGIWLSSQQLDADVWVAAQKGVLKFRITASVFSDERLSFTLADGPTESTAEVVDYIVSMPQQFKYNKISGKSIFYGSSDTGLGKPQEVDDSCALVDFIRELSQKYSTTIETIDLQTLFLSAHYQCGNRIAAGPGSDDILGCNSDQRSVYWIQRVNMDYANQCTRLNILRRRF